MQGPQALARTSPPTSRRICAWGQTTISLLVEGKPGIHLWCCSFRERGCSSSNRKHQPWENSSSHFTCKFRVIVINTGGWCQESCKLTLGNSAGRFTIKFLFSSYFELSKKTAPQRCFTEAGQINFQHISWQCKEWFGKSAGKHVPAQSIQQRIQSRGQLLVKSTTADRNKKLTCERTCA